VAQALSSPSEDATDEVWRAFFHKVDGLDKEVNELVFDTTERKAAHDKAYDYMTSGGGADSPYCDIAI
jgi:trehalose-6-phosphatase